MSDTEIISYDKHKADIRLSHYRTRRAALETAKDYLAQTIMSDYADRPAGLIEHAIAFGHDLMDRGASYHSALKFAKDAIDGFGGDAA